MDTDLPFPPADTKRRPPRLVRSRVASSLRLAPSLRCTVLDRHQYECSSNPAVAAAVGLFQIEHSTEAQRCVRF